LHLYASEFQSWNNSLELSTNDLSDIVRISLNMPVQTAITDGIISVIEKSEQSQ
jgi:hypothetical protein